MLPCRKGVEAKDHVIMFTGIVYLSERDIRFAKKGISKEILRK